MPACEWLWIRGIGKKISSKRALGDKNNAVLS